MGVLLPVTGLAKGATESPYRLVPQAKVPIEAYQLNSAYRATSTASGFDKPYAKEVVAAAREANLDPALVHAIIHVESRHQAHAVSPKGAVGLMQVLPETAARFGVHNPDRSVTANLRAGTLYLRSLMQQFDGRLDLVLAAYNAGENAVVRYDLAIPPYPETRRYVPAVMAEYEDLLDAGSNRNISYLPGTRLIPLR
jgi:soluble lytic murein transglycosylase-like protein